MDALLSGVPAGVPFSRLLHMFASNSIRQGKFVAYSLAINIRCLNG